MAEEKLNYTLRHIQQAISLFVESNNVQLLRLAFEAHVLNIALNRKWAQYSRSFSETTLMEIDPALIAEEIINDVKLHLRIQEEK